MKKYMYGFGAFALTLAMSGLPAIALAESNQDEGDIAQTQLTQESVREQQKQTAEVSREQQKQTAEVSREQQKNQLETSSSTRPSIKGGDQEGEINLDLEEDEGTAISNDALKQNIEQRKHQLDEEMASTSPEHQVIVANANEVRLAVHSLLASKTLLGDIGQQVSEIAKEVDHSVASTTNAEAKIQSRGFLARLFFGGDTTSAEVIAQEAAQNQQRIDSLTALLGQANISADIQATLKAQITALQDAQARLQDLAQKEKSAWGLFSWRF